jgi:LacI family transcriptional regulator
MELVPKRSSLVAQAVQILRDGMKAGLWKDHLPSEMAMCERFQISRVTLRAALAQLEREGWCSASQGRRRAINAAQISKANTVPSDRVCMLSPLPLQSLPASAIFWVDALREHLAAAGFKLEVLSHQPLFGKQPERALESIVHELRPAGWVLYLSTPAQQQWFSERGIPCVVSGSCHPGIQLSSVDIDYAATCAHAAGTLAGRGRTRIALLMPRSQQAGNLESERGFMDFVAKHPDIRGQVVHHDGTVPNICHMLDRFLRLSAPVDGLVVAKPAHVVTTVTHLLRLGVRLPKDVALISRDDDPVIESIVPVVARYHIAPGAFVRKLCRVVVDLVRTGPQRPHGSRLVPELIPGETLV